MTNYNRVRMIDFKQCGDARGHLVIVEGMQDVPFEIKRIFYIYGSDATVVRGQHANRMTCPPSLGHAKRKGFSLFSSFA